VAFELLFAPLRHSWVDAAAGAAMMWGGPFLASLCFRFALPPSRRERWTLWVTLSGWGALLAAWAIAQRDLGDGWLWVVLVLVASEEGQDRLQRDRDAPLDGAHEGQAGELIARRGRRYFISNAATDDRSRTYKRPPASVGTVHAVFVRTLASLCTVIPDGASVASARRPSSSSTIALPSA
jgi:hypothetical protein